MKISVVSFCLMTLFAQAGVLHVGNGQTYATLDQAILNVNPGDTVMVHAGTYAGGAYISNLQGNAAQWIYVMAAPGETVIYSGGSNAWHMVDAGYVHIQGFVFENQTANGFNIDDGSSYGTPSRYVIFENCTFRNINATGNNDLLKMSGVDDFEIRNCTFLNGSAGGSGIDMVGCHDGLIINCHFENQGSNSIQAKGGTANIRMEANLFKNGGQRAVNLGGSTGLPYFRPIDAKYEAAGLKVYANVFIGSVAPVAYVGCINTEVVNNTMYLPGKWILRILQETVDTARFYPCGNNTFRNNIIYRDNQVSTDCNVGPDTDPQSFTFSNNLWYHAQNAGWGGPNLPVTDPNSIISQDPLFANAPAEDFSLQPSSPAIGNGYPSVQPVTDHAGNTFYTPRSIGAFEGNIATATDYTNVLPPCLVAVYPNPASENITVEIHAPGQWRLKLFSLLGEEIYSAISMGKTNVDTGALSPGIYILKATGGERTVSTIITVQ